MAKRLRLWTFVRGEKYIEERFRQTIVRSLSWPQNRSALQDRNATWEIWGLEREFPFIADAAKDVGINLKLNAADQFVHDLPTEYYNDNGVMMLRMFLPFIEKCIEHNELAFLAPPDTYMGGETVPNILQAAEQPGTVVFVPHVRVTPDIPVPIGSIGNSGLAKIALQFAHKSFLEAEDGKERINTYIGGIYWKRRPNGVIAMSHRLPTAYAVNFTEEDLKFFSRPHKADEWPPVFGEWDHLWPAFKVYNTERARVIGSSDDAFICEVTEPEANIPALMNYSELEPDKFWRSELHNKMNRQFLYTLRPE